MRVASLGMYDADWLQAENDALWAAVRVRLDVCGVPQTLDRGRPLDQIMRDPHLLLGQTCGYPLMTSLHGVVQVVGSPVYDLPGCDGPTHSSFIVVRAGDPAETLDDLRGRRAAINGWDSNTGMNLLRASVAPLAGGDRFFSEVVVTGGHLASLAAVRTTAADVAAIDCVTYGLTEHHRPDLLAQTRVLQRTVSVPSLPFVTAASATASDVSRLRDTLAASLPWPGIALHSLDQTDAATYRVVLTLQERAAALDYPELR